MMTINMHVKNGDGSEAEVTARASDLIAFERHFDKPMTIFTNPSETRIEYILWLAWHGTKRQAAETPDFDAWVDSIEYVSVGESGE